MKKNDIIETEITAMSSLGSGIGKDDKMAVFVPSTAPGDVILARIVKVKKNYAYAITEKLIKPSPDRINSDCPVFGKCGGCAYRHISYEAESKIKQDRVYEAIKRIGGIDMKPQPIVTEQNDMRYRNKAQYPISENGKVGFFSSHSHRVIPCADCMLQPKEFAAASIAFEKWISKSGASVYNEQIGKGLIRHFYMRKAFSTGEMMAVAVINGDAVPDQKLLTEYLTAALGEDLKSIVLNINKADTNVILGNKNITVYGRDYINDILSGVKVQISALSFYQVNSIMAAKLYEKAAYYAEPEGKNILDLYCGAGTIGLSMAQKAKNIIGVEIVPDAVRDARKNAENNGILNAQFICADAAEAAKKLKEDGTVADVIIVDPPRKGCDEELLSVIAEDFAPERIVYVSCDPATLARDAARLEKSGYSLAEYTPFDLFPRTVHVETAAYFKKVLQKV